MTETRFRGSAPAGAALLRRSPTAPPVPRRRCGTHLDPGSFAASALAAREALGSLPGHFQRLLARLRFLLQALSQRQAYSFDGGSSVRQHRLLGEGCQALGVFEGSFHVAAVGDYLGARGYVESP